LPTALGHPGAGTIHTFTSSEGRRPGHAKIAGFARGTPMDIEHVNSIGTLLADLSARTEQLRGYL
jgi:hypothetical protein